VEGRSELESVFYIGRMHIQVYVPEQTAHVFGQWHRVGSQVRIELTCIKNEREIAEMEEGFGHLHLSSPDEQFSQFACHTIADLVD